MPDVRGVVVAGQVRPSSAGVGWQLDYLAGRLVEVSGTAALTMVARVMLEAQQRGESVVWISGQASIFFPPDVHAVGIDLQTLPVVRVRQPSQVVRAADALLRSGGFAVVVLDLGEQAGLSLSVQTRLAGLARRYDTALVGVTRKQSRSPSLGSLVSLRGECSHRRSDFDRFTCAVRAVKDKRCGTGWQHEELRRGPDGLC